MSVKLWDRYGKWLVKQVGFTNDLVSQSYTLLFEKLHDMDFTWVLDLDDSRAKDGEFLRRKYFDDLGISGNFNQRCSVLEMLIGFAIRLDNDYIGDPIDPHPEDIFIEMLANLGLADLYDENFDEDQMTTICLNWMTRNFEYNGEGSVFPLRNPTCDQRECDLWTQAMAYICENY